jgi:NADPH:quinone reductase-like Zn-dependent oxidoreductase
MTSGWFRGGVYSGAVVKRFGADFTWASRRIRSRNSWARDPPACPDADHLTVEQAAAVPISGTTAQRAVRDADEVELGQKVLTIGAGGGVGALSVQIANASSIVDRSCGDLRDAHRRGGGGRSREVS